MSKDFIVVKGARQHNLKNIDINIPRDQLVVITGLSGSGKSSLAFDTIYAEGQRRYVESLSAYARQFLGQMDKPDVDNIEGLSPAISIDQKTTSHNPRSTVGTVTEIHDYLRLLFARIGIPHCPRCGKVISRQSIDQIVDAIMVYPEGAKLQVLAPLVRGRKGEYVKLFAQVKAEGYLRLRVDGEIRELDEEIVLDKNKKHTIEVVVDRIIIRPEARKRIADSMELALGMAEGRALILVRQEKKEGAADAAEGREATASESGEEELSFNQNFACPDCNISLDEITPRMFSFNNPFGACPTCGGLGQLMNIDEEGLLIDENMTLAEGAIAHWGANGNSWYYRHIVALAQKYKFSLDKPIKNLPREVLDKIFYGSGKDTILVEYESNVSGRQSFTTRWEGIIPNFQRRYRETNSPAIRHEIETFMKVRPCPDCRGARLRPESLAVTIDGKNINEVSNYTIRDCREFFAGLKLTERETLIARQILKEIRERLEFLDNVGLDYLSLSRAAGTLSGGEAQRIRLATQIGSHLVGVLYILDEPSIGLHQRDNAHLIATLKRLRDLGNTVLVVEHDKETMEQADYLIDIGPGAGALGGQVVAAGTPAEVAQNENSITGLYLSGKKSIALPAARRQLNGKWLAIKGAVANNLKNIDVKIPLGVFTCVTGVSGSGKSTLVNDILYTVLAEKLNGAHAVADGYREITGLEYLEKVINIDQSPIGRTPRSNPATYTGVFNLIRELFAQTPEAKAHGYKLGRFSFNVKGGRCESCQGDGIIKIEMHFLPDIYVPCEVCKGKRYNRETLDIHYKGKNISDVLEMTVDEAVEFFANLPRIHKKLKVLQDVGLGYIHLGQQATTLSGGEAQRVKLATELSRKSDGRSFYILDEPTTGLHTADIKRLLKVLNRLVEAGDSVLVIEHNMDVIKSADYIIDLGPEGGVRGGEVIATGTPEEVAQNPQSYTGQFLQDYLK